MMLKKQQQEQKRLSRGLCAARDTKRGEEGKSNPIMRQHEI